jgi:hypothetical protein
MVELLAIFISRDLLKHHQACQIPGMLCRQYGHVESLRISIWLAVNPTRSTSILRHCGQ